MDHQQQTLGAVRQFDQHRTQQRPVGQVQAALRLQAKRFKRFDRLQRTLPEQIGMGFNPAILRLPAAQGLAEAQAQGVVMLDQRQQGGVQCSAVQTNAGAQYDGLVPVVPLGDVLVEKVLVNR